MRLFGLMDRLGFGRVRVADAFARHAGVNLGEDLAELVVLDTRIWGRDEHSDHKTSAEIDDPDRSLLGDDQRAWAHERVRDTTRPWCLLVTAVVFNHLELPVEKGAKLGTFVETKNTTMGEGAKANHLSYLGDAVVGARSNIGAGVITVNYDGVEKSQTEIGEDAFIGSDTMLVAPVSVGDRGSTGAGSVITKDVSEDALAIERSDQREIPGYAQRREARKAAKTAED